MTRTALLTTLAALTAALAAPGLAQAAKDPLLSGYGGPGAGEQVVIGSTFNDGGGGAGGGTAGPSGGSGGGSGGNQASGGSGGSGGSQPAGQSGQSGSGAGAGSSGGTRTVRGSDGKLRQVPALTRPASKSSADDSDEPLPLTRLELALAAAGLALLLLLVAGLRRLARREPEAPEAAASH
jgi:hypothetical protein